MTVCDDIPLVKLLGIWNNLNQCVDLRPASGLEYDVIKMATSAPIICILNFHFHSMPVR